MNQKRPSPITGSGKLANWTGGSHVPTDDDRRRILNARRQARARYDEIDAARDAEVAATLRAELGTVIRSASPLLISLLAAEGLTLDAAMAMMVSEQSSTQHPTRLNRFRSYQTSHNQMLLHYLNASPPNRMADAASHEHIIHRAGGGYITMKVFDHSVEVEVRLAPVWLNTKFGRLRVQLDEALPETLATAAVGRLFEEIVDHAIWRGRGWRIVDIEEPVSSFFGQTLIVAAGSVPYEVTWPDVKHLAAGAAGLQ